VVFPASKEEGPEGIAAPADSLALCAIRLAGTAIELVTRSPAASSVELVMLGTTLRELRRALAAGLVDAEALAATFQLGYEACRRDYEAQAARGRGPSREPRERPLRLA
jgi:hypothetical protein